MKQNSSNKEKKFDYSIGKILLKATRTLIDGRIKPIFTYKLNKLNLNFTCRLCGVTSQSGEVLNRHIVGKRHLNNLQFATLEQVNHAMLFPKFKKIIDSCDEPLVGAEYIIEMEQFDLNSCSGHLCLLCNIEKKNKLWDGRELKVHLLSNHHRLKFLQIHFPSAFNIIKNSTVHRESEQLNILLAFVCDKIEAKYGRLMPTMCNGKELKPETILKQSNSTYMDSELKRNLVLSMSNILNIYETKRKTITGDTITTKKNVQK